MVVSAIEIHTGEGELALLADGRDRPGSVVARGTLSEADREGWRSADLGGVPVIGGARYWIAERTPDCSLASRGTAIRYYGGFRGLDGPWEGPYESDTHNWLSRIRGSCP